MVATVNIEFAHVFPEHPKAQASFEKSYLLLGDYISSCRRRNENFTISILIDDNQSSLQQTYEWISSRLTEMQFEYRHLLYWGVASQLKSYRKQLYSCLSEEYRPQLSRRIESYLTKTETLGRTHTIAIWTLLRLGTISPFDSQGIRYRDILQKLTHDEASHFWSQRIATILSEEDYEYELRSESEILQYVNSAFSLLGRTDKVVYLY